MRDEAPGSVSGAVRWVYGFDEIAAAEAAVGKDWEGVRALLGGKGANLGAMTRQGVPVPSGFSVTTEACAAFLAEAGAFPSGLWEQISAGVDRVGDATGRRFGDPDSPLLLSCRSGSKFSMPGMMDTVLNIGLNDAVAAALVERTGDARFVYDLYRRLLQMFGSVVLGVDDARFEAAIARRRERAGVAADSELSGDDWRSLVDDFRALTARYGSAPFPSDPWEQLKRATAAVFASWNGKRAVDYRAAAGIPDDLGTAVNIQMMVFGNLGSASGTGVVMSRNPSTGEPVLDGDFLLGAQGEDVVAGIRKTRPIAELAAALPAIHAELLAIAQRLETHARDMQDIEFTIENGKLWILQTRNGKRTAQAEVRIAAEMVGEGLIDVAEAVRRVSPEQVDFFLHPQLDRGAAGDAKPIATGLDVSPGAAVGVVAFDADTAERWAREEGRSVVMVRPETKPDDVHGILAAKGVLTARGGRTSHAALVARQFGKPAVVGVESLEIDLDAREMKIGNTVVKEGEWISLDGTHGEVYLGELPTVVPDLENPYLRQILEWADDLRTLGVRANADGASDAARARAYGAEGIGLCRTEHMFFAENRLAVMQRMILARSVTERKEAIADLLPHQRDDFAGIFRAMDGLPVIIRLLDPPLHEFLPDHDELVLELADFKLQLQHLGSMAEIEATLEKVRSKQELLARVVDLREMNPMLGTRGVRLAILIPELTRMQTRAILEAACTCADAGVVVRPKIMIPLTADAAELAAQRAVIEAEARAVLEERRAEIAFEIGSMIELPRAALLAGEIARYADFFSFGTNDLTQTTFGISRDDAERGFLRHYLRNGILADNPFETLDGKAVGELIRIAVERGRRVKPGLEVGVCGEHGGDPRSIALCHEYGLDYVSCSAFRVPIARLAAAHAALAGRQP